MLSKRFSIPLLITGLFLGSMALTRLAKDPLDQKALWAMLATHTITPERAQTLQKEYKNAYYARFEASKSDRPAAILSSEIKAVLDEVLADFGLNDIKILPMTDFSPAYATDSYLFINEKALKEYDPACWHFMIGHELGHIIHQDGSTYFALSQVISKEGMKDPQHPLNQYRHFCERRADYTAITKGPKYAQGAELFFSSFLATHGEDTSSTHPSIASRLQMAQAYTGSKPASALA